MVGAYVVPDHLVVVEAPGMLGVRVHFSAHIRQVSMRAPHRDPALPVPAGEVSLREDVCGPEHHALRWCKSDRHGRERKARDTMKARPRAWGTTAAVRLRPPPEKQL